MTSFAAPRTSRTTTSSFSPARSAQRLGRPFAAAGASVARSFRSFNAAADLQRGADDQGFTAIMFGRS
jgi:hypothetical protein